MKKLYLTALALGLLTTAQAQFAIQKVILEEFTGAWCQYCADGAVIAQQVADNYENAIVVSVHDGDAMEVQEGRDLADFYSPSYPQALINRSGALVSRNQWNSQVGTALQGASVVEVAFDSISYNDATREISLKMITTFSGVVSGDVRVNLFIVEDNVTGTGSGYNQVNANNNTPGHPYYQAGNPIVGFNHRHVFRDALEGTWGLAGFLPSSISFGQQFTKWYTYTIPAGFKAEDIALVGLVQRYDGGGVSDRKILNGEEFHLSALIVSNEQALDHGTAHIQVAPNPMGSSSKISFALQETGQVRLEVLNTLGQHVATLGQGLMTQGLHTINWNGSDDQGNSVENGIYLIRLLTENGQSATTKVMLTR